MSPQTRRLSLGEQRSHLERRANVIRSRLLQTIDALDQRRHQVQELGHHVKRLTMPIAAGALGVVALAAGATFGIRALLRLRRERRFGYRVSQALAPLRRERRPPFWNEALRKVALTALGILSTELTKRGAQRFVVSRTRTIELSRPARSLGTPRLAR